MTNPIDNFFSRLAMEDRNNEDCETFERRMQEKRQTRNRRQERELKRSVKAAMEESQANNG